MNLLALVLAGHFIGDWLVQTDWQAAEKGWVRIPTPTFGFHGHGYGPAYWRSWKTNQAHMLGYHLTLGVLVAFALPWLPLLVLLAVSWVTHSFIDRRWPVRWLMEYTRSGAFAKTPWGPMAVDQALHLSILCLLVAVLA